MLAACAGCCCCCRHTTAAPCRLAPLLLQDFYQKECWAHHPKPHQEYIDARKKQVGAACAASTGESSTYSIRRWWGIGVPAGMDVSCNSHGPQLVGLLLLSMHPKKLTLAPLCLTCRMRLWQRSAPSLSPACEGGRQQPAIETVQWH